MNLYQKISKICKEKRISINELEEKAGLSTGSIYKWNTVSPTVKNLKKVADVLGTTVGELIGEEDVTYEKYKKIRDDYRLTDSMVSEATGINKSTFSDWKTGRSRPKMQKLIILANFFGVSVEYFSSLSKEINFAKNGKRVDKKEIKEKFELLVGCLTSVNIEMAKYISEISYFLEEN